MKFKKDKLSKISSSPDTMSKDIPQPSQDTVQSSGENSSTTSSAILKRVHPWCKISQAKEETKDESTQKVNPAKQRPSVESSKTSQRSLVEDTQDTEECSLKKQLADNTVKENSQKEKKEIKKRHSSLSSLKTTIPEQKAN